MSAIERVRKYVVDCGCYQSLMNRTVIIGDFRAWLRELAAEEQGKLAELEQRIGYRLTLNEQNVQTTEVVLGPDAPPVAKERHKECAMILGWVRELQAPQPQPEGSET